MGLSNLFINNAALLRQGFWRVSAWMRAQFAAGQRFDGEPAPPVAATKPLRRKRLLICAAIFVTAVGVRLLHWQDLHAEIEQGDTLLSDLLKDYQHNVRQMMDESALLFVHASEEPEDARILEHPPGYSILLLGLYRLPGDPSVRLRLLQVLCDAAAAVLIFLIAAEMLPVTVGFIAGLLVALSPHLAYYSLWLTPDSLAVLPVVLATYLFVRAIHSPRLSLLLAAGAALGISCWLRANGLLLVPFFLIPIILLFPRGRRLRYAGGLAVAMLLVIAPITIRNWAVFQRFIPLSLGAGITLIEGIADYDDEGQFGMPASDRMTAYKDAEWADRPDYAANLWVPDGIRRERTRLSRGLGVIQSRPAWFLTVMLKRAAFMLQYNDSRPHRWPFNTAIVPVVGAQSSFAHSLALPDGLPPIWKAGPADLLANGQSLSPQTTASLTPDGSRLRVVGDASEFGDQFVSAPIPLKKNHDYLLMLPARLDQRPMAVKVTSADRRIALAAKEISARDARLEKKAARRNSSPAADPNIPEDDHLIWVPFASGDKTEVCLVFSNNGRATDGPAVQVGEPMLFELGPNPYIWTKFPRTLTRAVQKNLFVTGRMLPLVGIGLILLALAGNWRALVVLLTVPVYYLAIQSTLHTEYRYTLAIHYFLMVLTAAALFIIGTALLQSVRRAYQRLTAAEAIQTT